MLRAAPHQTCMDVTKLHCGACKLLCSLQLGGMRNTCCSLQTSTPFRYTPCLAFLWPLVPFQAIALALACMYLRLLAACRLRDELDRLDQQHRARVEEEEEMLAAAVEAEKTQSAMPRVKPGMALALVNIRNRCGQQ